MLQCGFLAKGTILLFKYHRSTKDRLHPEDLPPHIANYTSAAHSNQKTQALAEVEKSHIKDVLLHTASIEEAAQVLSIDPATLWRKRKKYQLD